MFLTLKEGGGERDGRRGKWKGGLRKDRDIRRLVHTLWAVSYFSRANDSPAEGGVVHNADRGGDSSDDVILTELFP